MKSVRFLHVNGVNKQSKLTNNNTDFGNKIEIVAE